MSSPFRIITSAFAAICLAALAGLAAAPASAAPGDAYSFRVDGPPSFIDQTGTTETRVFSLFNDGTEPLIFAASPALTTPLHVDSSTGMSGETVLPGASATFTVTFTAGVAGTMTSQSVMLYATDTTATVTIARALTLTTSSIATPLAHYTVDTSMLSFGPIQVGTSSTRSFTIVNDGVLTLRFCLADIEFFDNVGDPLSGFTATGSSFGVPCGSLVAGASGTVEVTYSPTEKIEPFVGIVRVSGYFVNGDVVSRAIVADGTLTAAAVDPAPQPTTAPTTPAVVQPLVVRPGAAAGAQLAHTGAEPAFAIGFGTLTLALGGVALSIALGARRKARRS